MAKETVLISGGAGYIGSHTAVELIAAGYDAVIIDNLSNSEAAAVEGVRRITGVDVPFERVDTCDEAALRRVFEKIRFRLRHPLRRLQGCRRVGRRTAQILPQQPRVVHERLRADEGVRPAEHPLLVVGDGLRRARHIARHGADAPQTRHLALRQHEADGRRHPARLLRGLRGACTASRCATSTPSAPTPRRSSANCRAACRRIWCPTSPRRPPDCANAFRSSATTTTRPTAPACVTTSTSSTWPKPT